MTIITNRLSLEKRETKINKTFFSDDGQRLHCRLDSWKVYNMFVSLDQEKYLFLVSKKVLRKDMSHAVQLSFLLRSPRPTFIGVEIKRLNDLQFSYSGALCMVGWTNIDEQLKLLVIHVKGPGIVSNKTFRKTPKECLTKHNTLETNK